MIYITGDTHGDFSRFSNRTMKKEGNELTENDYMIICGDFGLCWIKDKTFDYNCEFFANKKYTTLWVQGNHDNYDMIAEYPVEEWHGGKVRHIVRDKVILLERGQVFEIEGRTFFTFGGASSHDVEGGILNRDDIDFDVDRRIAIENKLPFRIAHESWWEEELPDEAEMTEGWVNLEKQAYKVDYVITHCCDTQTQNKINEIKNLAYEADELTDYLDAVNKKISYRHWFFGHYHLDMKIDERHTLLYYDVVSLTELEKLYSKPILGQPRYTRGNKVRANINGEEMTGTIFGINPNGSLAQNEEPSYDILVENVGLFKEICESLIACRDE